MGVLVVLGAFFVIVGLVASVDRLTGNYRRQHGRTSRRRERGLWW